MSFINVWKQFVDDAVHYIELELNGESSLQENVKFIDKYRSNCTIETELLNFIENLMFSSVSLAEQLNQVLLLLNQEVGQSQYQSLIDYMQK